MSKWRDAADPEPSREAREMMQAMVGCHHPADRPAKWRELAEYAARRAKEVQADNEQHGVPER